MINLFSKKQLHFLLQFCLKFLIKKGNKTKSFIVINNSLSLLKKMTRQNAFIILFKSIKHVEPFCEVKNLRIRGVTRKVPVAIYSIRQKYLAIKFLTTNSKKRNEKTTAKKLTLEFLDALALTGRSVKSCVDLHNIAETNKVFLQYRS
jgi:small subunit ribosomal protein S7|uniref:Ribosomal protein S7 n=1 Tax=Baffinella frigidus TaxID=2571260 RepID=A0A6C0X6C9_9CRYP|nr:ribosomal protein S7 [Cryptophyta sp. CCMP2293]